MESFALQLKATKVRLQNNKPLNDFCLENFRKPIEIRRLYKAPNEVELSDLLMIFITHPCDRSIMN